MVAILRPPASGSRQLDETFSRDGDADIEQGLHRFYADHDLELVGVVVSAGVAPTGGDLVVDVILDAFDGGGSVYTAVPKPTIVADAFVGFAPAPDTTAVPQGHYLTVDIVAIGLTDPGSKIDVRILYR